MKSRRVCIHLIDYSGAMQSAISGFQELFQLANRITQEHDGAPIFSTTRIVPEQLPDEPIDSIVAQVVLLPPSIDGDYYLHPNDTLLNWIIEQHTHGAVICSACAGAFIVAATGLLEARPATTHWALAEAFTERFDTVLLDSQKILINDGDIISAGGLMSWLDLGLELVAQYASPMIMRQLGKYMIVDTGAREQRYYQSFIPRLNHGDELILQIQHHLQCHYHQSVSIARLAMTFCITERTLLRRFVKATGFKPLEYLQRLRVQKACELIETTKTSLELIASQVGYEDVSSFRKIFRRTMGLMPSDFKARFVR